jgi:predicted RNA-binding protein with TRAM domain
VGKPIVGTEGVTQQSANLKGLGWIHRRARTPLLVAVLGVTLAVGGCGGMSSLTSGIGGGWFGGGAAGKPEGGVTAENMLTAAKADGEGGGNLGGEIIAGCPRFQVNSSDSHVTIYEAGRSGDGLAVMHRGEITKTARECIANGNKITIKYGISGRVLLGPKGRGGNVVLPLTVFVTDAKRERIATDKLKIDVAVALEKPIGYFSSVREVTITVPEGARPGEFEVFVGFDRNIPGAG